MISPDLHGSSVVFSIQQQVPVTVELRLVFSAPLTTIQWAALKFPSWLNFFCLLTCLCFIYLKLFLHSYTIPSLVKPVGFLPLELGPVYSKQRLFASTSLLYIFIVLMTLMDGALNYLASIKLLPATPSQTLVLPLT